MDPSMILSSMQYGVTAFVAMILGVGRESAMATGVLKWSVLEESQLGSNIV